MNGGHHQAAPFQGLLSALHTVFTLEHSCFQGSCLSFPFVPLPFLSVLLFVLTAQQLPWGRLSSRSLLFSSSSIQFLFTLFFLSFFASFFFFFLNSTSVFKGLGQLKKVGLFEEGGMCMFPFFSIAIDVHKKKRNERKRERENSPLSFPSGCGFEKQEPPQTRGAHHCRPGASCWVGAPHPVSTVLGSLCNGDFLQALMSRRGPGLDIGPLELPPLGNRSL